MATGDNGPRFLRLYGIDWDGEAGPRELRVRSREIVAYHEAGGGGTIIVMAGNAKLKVRETPEEIDRALGIKRTKRKS